MLSQDSKSITQNTFKHVFKKIKTFEYLEHSFHQELQLKEHVSNFWIRESKVMNYYIVCFVFSSYKHNWL